MDVNFWGAVYCTKSALDYLVKSKGIIIGISSVAGFVGLPGRSGYSASKAAMNGWLATLRTELKSAGVSVITVCPGFTASNIRKVALNKHAQPEDESKLDEGKLMSAEACAQHIFNAAQKKKRMLILTSEGKQAVFFSRFFPSLTDELVHKFYFKKGQFVK
jgi:short-subunit dehydrogenase